MFIVYRHNTHATGIVPAKKIKAQAVRSLVSDIEQRLGRRAREARKSPRENLAEETTKMVYVQPFMQNNEGWVMRGAQLPCGKLVRDAVVEEAHRIWDAIPPSSSMTTTSVARWSIHRVCKDHNLGSMNARDRPSHSPSGLLADILKSKKHKPSRLPVGGVTKAKKAKAKAKAKKRTRR